MIENKRRVPVNETQIDRRVIFLINEVQSGTAFRDQVVTCAFRVITNYFSVNDDVRSNRLRKICPYRSKRAHELSISNPIGWLNEVTNEHQYPIKYAWEWMLREREVITVQSVKEHLRKWPIVVITKEEDRVLRRVPWTSPAERYMTAGIKILKRIDSGTWEPIGAVAGDRTPRRLISTPI